MKDIGVVVHAILKLEEGTLTLATNDGSAEPPEGFSSAMSLYELRSVNSPVEERGSARPR